MEPVDLPSGPPELEGLELVADVSAGDWIRDRLRPWDPVALKVWTIVPSEFEAYARIFHPATIWTLREGEETPDVRFVRWSEVAEWSGRTIVPGRDWEFIATRDDGARWDEQPYHADPPEGDAYEDLFLALARVLGPFTGTPGSVWYAVWDGWGDWQMDRAIPRLELPARTYVLFRGALDALSRLRVGGGPSWFRTPALTWPDDRAWCVACEIDYRSTFIAGSRRAIDAVLAEPELESIEVRADDIAETSVESWPDEGMGQS
ncbi:MAG: hypothetical protein WD770_02325 [Actinomycetota bacterium]